MYIVWYGAGNREFLVQTDNVAEVRAKVESQGFVVKDVVKRG